MKIGAIIRACEEFLPHISPRPTVLAPGICLSNVIKIVALVLISALRVAFADCECGYYCSSSQNDPIVFTELLESDFLHVQNITLDTDWVPQQYNITAEAARGPYGEARQLMNVIENPIKDDYSYSGPTVSGGDPGLRLYVRKFEPEQAADGQSERLVGTAEVASQRDDILYGSFRIAMKLSGTPGTCGAFFWFFNNTQEIDIEFLSSELNSSSSPVNLVLQSPESARAGYDASHTTTFRLYELPFRPDEDYHEYRFDWLPGKVSFYADGHWLWDSSDAVPTKPGHLIMNHWSNGNSKWSRGPPTEDAFLSISYVKAYFNSSLDSRHADYARRCKDSSDARATCLIPDQLVPPSPIGPNGNETGNTFFFSHQPNMTVNQTVYRPEKNAGGTLSAPMLQTGLFTALFVGPLVTEVILGIFAVIWWYGRF
ncbi:glycoside hydrolase family 16 protein [Xylona heveae TC161]|uniref:Glycoside hydrolase family 16 protein n=1 Tax=Xylona heveae (strain CBS 132557 / TC161) TaxID=1328760 RepID=A0A165JQT9_XYLHT|nr:glycoside hydrolase family 16 protein [Xylona heveae TC161]KZF26522.1 glycoside hydrolase family 16 protein [Xylona heveae TC161]